jgi:flavin-dependent dehydrogenase
MSTHEIKWDAIVVGAGTAGATAAMHMARGGRRVLMLDARPLGECGARWVNAIPDWMFEESGVPAPTERPELRSRARRHVMVDPSWTHRVVLEGSPVLFVDMRHLVERVQREAVAAGARASGEEPVRELLFDRDRVVGVRTPRGEHRAPLVVDASGLAGVVRAKVPALRERWPAPKGGDVCSAAQEVRAIGDREGAARWLAEHGTVGDALGVIGLEGGFSTRLIQVDLDRGEVEILTGAIAERGRASGQALVDEFVRDNPWVGAKLFGGSGAIPLRRPYDKLAARGVALVGDAGC